MNRPLYTFPEIDDAAAEWVVRRDAGLRPAEHAQLAAWREADPRHAEALARFEAIWMSAAYPRKAGVTDALERRIRRIVRRNRRRRLSATAAALMIGLGTAWLWHLPHPASVPPQTPATATVMVPHQQTLPDGSTIDFPAGTVFTVNVSEAERRVTLLKGEAHFTVAKNPAQPFIVEVGGIEFRALGTAFLVELRPDSAHLLVTKGKVAVEKGGTSLLSTVATSNSPSRPSVVEAGRGLIVELGTPFPLATEVTIIPEAEMSERLAWRNPRVEFSGTPLAGVVNLINRYNETQLVILDPQLSQVQLSGVFRADDVESFVHSLEVGFGVTAERSGERLILRRIP